MNWDVFKREELDSISDYDAIILQETANTIESLVSCRKNKNISQKELAQMTGLKQSAIARFESCGATPRLETILKITHALGYRIAFLPKL